MWVGIVGIYHLTFILAYEAQNNQLLKERNCEQDLGILLLMASQVYGLFISV